jgi:hypothetical protein
MTVAIVGVLALAGLLVLAGSEGQAEPQPALAPCGVNGRG